MPFGLPSVAAALQRNLRSILATQEAMHHMVLTEMETVHLSPRASRGSRSRWLMRSNFFSVRLQLPLHSFDNKTR